MASPNSGIFSIGDDESHLTSAQTQIPLTRARRASDSLLQVPNNLTQAQKKPRLSNQVDDQTRQILRPWLQRREMLQQQRAKLQQQLQQSWLQQQLQLRQMRYQQQQLQQFRGPRLYEDSVCARRLVEYLYRQRHRPSNSIDYWRNFMTEFFSPCAKKRWCLSYINNLRHSTPGPFPQAATVTRWQCNLCDSKSGIGVEATFDRFPRLHAMKFASGVLDEIFTLNTPSERRYGSGITLLEYDKVVQETVFAHARVVREGHLRLTFSPQLKILSWDFCTRRLRLQKLVPQVNQVAEKCQSTINQSGSDGISQQDLQGNSNMVMAARSQLAKSVESGPLHDLGFSKPYFRGLQTSEIVSSMKDMKDFCHDQKVAPIEAFKSNFCRMMALMIEQLVNGSRGLPPDMNNSLNKHMALRNSGTNIAMNNMNGQGSLPASAQATASVLANYQTMLMKQNHPKSEPNNTTIKQEPSTRNQNASQGYQGSGPLLPGFVQIKQEPSTRNQNASQGYQGSAPLLPGFVQIKQEPSTRNQNASQGYQGSGPLLPGFVQIKQEPSISGVSSHLSPQQKMPRSMYNGSTQQYHQQPPSGSRGNQTLEQKPLCVPAAETPSTSDKGTNGLDQSQNLEDMGSDTSLDIEIDMDKIWERFCVRFLSTIN